MHTTKGGRVVVYTGDDQVNEHVYKFVSAHNWHAARARGRSPLDEGTLYVAKFNDDGTGEWLPLVHGVGPLTADRGYADQGDVLVKTRLAASDLGATQMDRPEWTTVHQDTGMVYVTLTNNTSAAKVESAANPRKPNLWGHIVRWREAGNDHTSTTFEWDLFLLAGQGRDSGDGSTIDEEDGFGSPDGIWADPDGRVWIQTDGTQPADANDQMLAANPYRVDEHGTPELRRFLTGVPGCEVTGVVTTPDQRTMFVNIQHPGELKVSQWPQEDGLTTPSPPPSWSPRTMGASSAPRPDGATCRSCSRSGTPPATGATCQRSVGVSQAHPRLGGLTAAGRRARTRARVRRTPPRAPATAARPGRGVRGPPDPRRTRAAPGSACGRGCGRAAGEVLRLGVVRAVDDPQVLPAADLDARLRQAPSGAGEVGQRLDDHALAAGRGQLDSHHSTAGGHRLGVRRCRPARGGSARTRSGAAATSRSASVEVPDVVAGR